MYLKGEIGKDKGVSWKRLLNIRRIDPRGISDLKQQGIVIACPEILK